MTNSQNTNNDRVTNNESGLNEVSSSKTYNEEGASFAKIATVQTPLFPKDIYDSLPKLLKSSCKYADDGRSKDVMLLSTLTILSACSRGIQGIYDKKETYPNLYTFIVAPAASGKGIMNEAKSLGYKLHDKISKDKDERFVESNAETPLLFIPASGSKVAIINHLKDSKNYGIICETEADTLYSALKQQWGDFSDLLRKAFHNEEISHTSNSDGYSSLKQPKLSVLLTSTPSQVPGIIESPENGLFSRFIYYNYTSQPKFKDVFAEDNIDYSSHYENLSKKAYEFAEFSIENPCKFSFTTEQKHLFIYFFKKRHAAFCISEKKEDISVINRAAGICFRIAMLLTDITRFEEKNISETVECSSENFKIALDIYKVLEHHSVKTINDLSGKSKSSSNSEFLKTLPNKFKRCDIVKQYEGIIPRRTVYHRIDQLMEDKKLKASPTSSRELYKTGL